MRLEGLKKRVRRSYKYLRWRVQGPPIDRRIGFVMGCQRSGTSTLIDGFDRDLACKMYGEDGGLAFGQKASEHMRFRWRPDAEIQGIFSREQAPLIIAKPLVESQNALRLLRAFPAARIIWAFRHYQDVASSSQVRFGADTTLYNLGAVLDPGKSTHWYSENLSGETRSIVTKYFDPRRSIYDLKALGWFVRNSLYFQQELGENPRVTMCKYEDLVADAGGVMKRLYSFLDAPYPGPSIVAHIHPHSLRKGAHVDISDDMRALCDTMLQRLEETYTRTLRRTSDCSSPV